MGWKIILAIGCLSGLVSATPAFASETITYIYDSRGRLVSVAHSGTVNNGVQVTYTYDKADNRTNVTVNGAPPGSGEGGGGGATSPPQYRYRYLYNGRFSVSVVQQ